MSDIAQSLARAAAKAWLQRLETVCEAALQSGRYGVLIEGDFIQVSSEVPYGCICHVVAGAVVDDE
jgi:hypothetical protein